MVPSTLDRLLDPIANCLTPDVAGQIANLKVDAATQSRLDDLAQRSNSGSVTETETAEYRELVEAIDLVGILQAKARRMVRHRAGL